METIVSPEQKLLLLMVRLEWSELKSQSLPSSSEKGESDRGEPLSFGRKGWRTRRGMRLRGLPFSGDFLSCSTQTSVRSPVGKQLRSTSPLCQVAKGFRFRPQTTDSTCKNQNAGLPHILGTVPLCFTACFFPPDEWRGEKVKPNVLFIRVTPTWQCFNVAFRLMVHKGPVFELWCLPNPTHPVDMQTRTRRQAHWHSLAQLTGSHAAMTVPNWVYDQVKQHYPPKTRKRVCFITNKVTKIKWKKLELNWEKILSCKDQVLERIPALNAIQCITIQQEETNRQSLVVV